MFIRRRLATHTTHAPRTRWRSRFRPVERSEHLRPRLSRRKRIAFTLLTLALLAVLMVLCGEFVFRARQYVIGRRMRIALAEDGPAAGWAVYDRDIRYRNRPNWQEHNEWGMRDEPLGSKRPDRYRLLWLGDSIGYYGDSIDDTYPEQLETQLNAVPGLMACEVLNAGTKGYTNFQELLYLKKFGPGLEPDGVAAAFCVNDLRQFLHEFHLVDGKLVADSYDFTPDVKKTDVPDVLRPSLFLSWTWRRGRGAMARLRNDMLFESRPDISPAWEDEHWPELEKQLAEMKSVAAELEAPLFLIAFPHALQYRSDYLDRDREHVLKPQRKLEAICQRLDIPLLDLYPAFEYSDFEDDGLHLMPTGRQKAAEAIREFIVGEQLIPGK